MSEHIVEQLAKHKIVPVIQINKAEHAVPLAKTLVENGLPVAEVTFRTDAAAEAIHLMRKAYPELCLGAGTVLNEEQIDSAKESGASFAVAPGLNPTSVLHCRSIELPMIPGVNNPSQIEQGLELGLNFLKFFPAQASGGPEMIKALLAPYRDIRLMPTGGISKDNIHRYLEIERVDCCGGSWMVPPTMIDDGDWDGLGHLIREAVALVNREA
ncbi:bifunctional 4-hydroxy-2-oxoglutarate aldolase/2-dehydro-3-deoxy-phosphogluconate aldolase [Veronia pacifica]|uniref:2-dehydro-3-deoxy-phosphogluconate aldolase n=1 Tax=Veronia pacifica TaxID=1080227 RepID=A0A1C3E884_9GAMM|nr:bifunctional 4-hydroxy-2-oxoglutarate aldolase/2-dehydro-3-deoxy-phosphogluconate aldolase [Veronia pacifica]ODA29450.1 2-dehydro-3-deoxyphosphogluconate aldolase [Veronia pacifica]